jgi:hypothetical protein
MNTPNPTPVLPQLKERAMLAYLKVSCWSGRKLDRKATAKVTKDAKASDDAGRFNKNLLADADERVKELQSIAGKARRLLEANSLPWDDAGNRLLSNGNAMTLIGDIGKLRDEYNQVADLFTQEYPAVRAQALAALGDMADPQDYPPPDVVRSKFSLQLSLAPLPDGFGDERTGLEKDQVASLQKHFEANARMQFETALLSAWEQLRVVVANISERLTNEPGAEKRKIYRDSLIENARETCALLKSLNVFGDAELDEMRFHVEQTLCAYDADQLRKNDALANSVKNEADKVLARMRELLGEG